MTKIYKANNIKAAVASSLPDANQTGMANGGICTIQGSNSWYYRTFLQYDLSGIPINSTILSAKMYIYCRSQNGNAATSGTTNISRVTSDWNEATLSWNRQPTFTGTYLPKNVSPPSVGTWGEWDITSLVNEWYTKQYPNYGLYIKNNNEGAYRVNWDTYNYHYDEANSNDGDDSNNFSTYLLIEYVKNSENSGYLIKSDSIIYTIIDNELSPLVETELTSELFIKYKIDILPSPQLLLQLNNPEVIYWTDILEDELPNIKYEMNATPLSQTIISNKIDLTDESILGIENIIADCEGELLMAVSFDEKKTWKVYSESGWATALNDFTGMSKETVEAITYEQWNELYAGATDFYIRIALTDLNQFVKQITVNFLKK